ncbi:MAG: GerMN domain-containing protein [Bacilli bacterium]|nr:GerMN domain-containing protein [Bacilli bacterium]
MIRKKAIQKIFRTTLCLFLLLVVSTISSITKEKTIPVMVTIEDVTSVANSSIYLTDRSGYFVKKPILLSSDRMEDNVFKIISYLKKNNLKYSSRLNGFLEESVSLNQVYYDENYLILDFNQEFQDSKNLSSCVISIVYSLMELDGVDGVTILVEGDYLEGYPKILNKSLDINPVIHLTSRSDIAKVVVYYLLEDDGDTYYVPVTKYLNDSRNKIDIIVDELSSNPSMDLVSVVNRDLELIDSREENDIFVLNFNHSLFDSNDEVLEEVLYCISYSVFENYDVSMVMVEVDGKNVRNIEKNEL